MATYYLKMWLPNPQLVHGPDFEANGRPQHGPNDGSAPAQMPPMPPKPQVTLDDHGTPPENFFEGDVTLILDYLPDGKLEGTANGKPIGWGYHNAEFFKLAFSAGPGQWEIWARVHENGNVEGMISVGNGGGYPNLVYGKKLE